MRFTFTNVMTRSEYLPRLAVAAEAAGYDGFTIPDSIAYPEHSVAVYPYTGDGDRSFLEGKEFIEPSVLAASLGARTSSTRSALRDSDLVTGPAGTMRRVYDETGIGMVPEGAGRREERGYRSGHSSQPLIGSWHCDPVQYRMQMAINRYFDLSPR